MRARDGGGETVGGDGSEMRLVNRRLVSVLASPQTTGIKRIALYAVCLSGVET